MLVTVLVLAVELKYAFPPIFERGLGRVSKWHVCGREKKALKNHFFEDRLTPCFKVGELLNYICIRQSLEEHLHLLLNIYLTTFFTNF